ncbi:PK1L2-like protein, partial [Mya arenaria]
MAVKTEMIQIFVVIITSCVFVSECAYLGCYLLPRRGPAYGWNPGVLPKNKIAPAECTVLCGEYNSKYTALKDGKFCHCVDHSPSNATLELVDDGNCSVQCSGDSGAFCGSAYHASVYESMNPVTVKLEANVTGPTTVGAVVVFDPNPFTTGSGVAAKFDYDDGAGVSDYSSASNTEHVFHLAGHYHVDVYGSSADGWLPPVQSSVAVEVQSRVRDVVVTCPQFMATYEPMIFSVNVVISSVGYGWFEVVGQQEIFSGDVLAFDATATPLLAQRNGTVGDFHCTGFSGGAQITMGTSCTELIQQQSQLKATYARKSRVYYPIMFTNKGNVTLQATASNLAAFGGSDVGTAEIAVIEGVDIAYIIPTTTCIAVNEITTISIKPYTGDPANVFIDWGDSTNKSVTSAISVTKIYLEIGNYNVFLNISNYLSYKENVTQFCVEERITNVALNLSSGVEVDVATVLELSMASGSNYTCDYEFIYSDSTSDVFTRSYLDGDIFSHTFPVWGTVDITVVCQNTINAATYTHQLTAVERISGDAITPPGALMNVPFTITLTWATGSHVSVSLSYDGIAQTMTVDAANKQATSELKTEDVLGAHTIIYTISNPLDPNPALVTVTFAIEVKITSPDIHCTFSNLIKMIGSTAVIPINTDITCDVTMSYGTSVTLEIDYGYSGATYNQSNAPGVPWTNSILQASLPQVHNFTKHQYCNVYVHIYNNFNEYEEWFPVWVMVPVDGVTLQPYPVDNPKRFDPPAIVNFFFTIPGLLIPNEVTCEVTWGDGNKDIYFPCDLTNNLTHTYLDSDGDLSFSYELYNHISEEMNGETVYIVAPILNEKCFTDRKAGIPGDSIQLGFSATRAPPAGILDLEFDCGNAVTPTNRKRLGTFVWYDVTAQSATDIYSCNSTDPDFVITMINKAGTYDVTVVAKNPVHTGPAKTATIEMSSPVINPLISDSEVTRAYEEKTFNISMESYGTAQCVAFYSGKTDNIVILYGNPVDCDDTDAGLNTYFPGKIFQLSAVLTDVSQSFEVQMMYTAEDTYTAEVYAWNMFSNEFTEFEFPVSRLSCSAPNLAIIDGRPNFLYPKECRRSNRCKIIGSVDLQCPNTLQNTKSWTVEKWNGFLNQKILDIDLTTVRSRVNSELALEPSFLTLGLYKITFISLDWFELGCVDLTENETLPVDTTATTVGLSLPDLPGGHVDAGGCFQQGPGFITNFNSGYLVFNTAILKPTHVYQITVIGFKIPTICQLVHGKLLFNPNSEIGLVSVIKNKCATCTYSYAWKMYAYDYQFCGPIFNCWRELVYLGNYIEGLASDQLTIKTALFGHYPAVDDFQLRLSVTNDNTGVMGRVVMNMTRNHPPTNGNCSITPVNPLPLLDFPNTLLSLQESSDDAFDIMDAIANLDDACSKADALQAMLDLMGSNDETDLNGLGSSLAYAATRLDDPTVRAGAFTTSMMLELLKKALQNLRNNSAILTVEEIETLANSSFETCTNIELVVQAQKLCTEIQFELTMTLASQKPMSNTPIILNTGSVETRILKNRGFDLENQTLSIGGCDIKLPPNLIDSSSASQPIIFKASTYAAPSVPVEDGGAMGSRMRQVRATFMSEDGTVMRLNNLQTPILLKIASDPNAPRFNWSDVELASPQIPASQENEYCFFHEFYINNPHSAAQLKFRLTNETKGTQLLVMVSFEDKPQLGSNIIAAGMIPQNTRDTGFYGDEYKVDPYQLFLDADVVGNNVGTYKVCVRQLLPDEENEFDSIGALPDTVPTIWKTKKEFLTDYQFFPVILSCAYTEDGSSIIKTDNVKPHALCNESTLVCETNHFTTFGGNWMVAPNKLDWNFIFSNADFLKNPTLYVTEMLVLILYLGLTPLLDNDRKDKYYYEVLVSTGMRRGAGTDSKVHFVLSGEEEETDVRTFEDKKRKIFTRGSDCGFLMAVPEPLGPLTYLRIWHDNSGKGRFASWYLNHVLVRDVQTDKKYYFIANKWFAVEEDDGQVDRVIPVSGRAQMTEFSHLFQQQTAKNLSDGHLWFSVVARPPQSRFTRCQRVSCCLCLLFSSMLANAMFYNTASSDSNAYQFGPFAVTSEQIFIGIISNLIIFPINFLLITIFRKSRPRTLRKSRVQEALDSLPERSTSMADVNMRVKSSMSMDRPGSSFLMDANRSASSMSRPESSMANTEVKVKEVKKKKKCELPWWFVIIGWILLWIAVLVSAAFVTFYGIQFQDIKCKKWITSMLISFITSIFFTQPIKVFLVAIIFSFLIRKPTEDEEEDEEDEPRILKEDEEYLHKEEEEDEFGYITPKKPLRKPKPPDTQALARAREERLKEIQMWAIIREILFYAFFLWILIIVSYRSVSTNSWRYKNTMEKVFIQTNDTKKAFTKVHNTDDFWTWARSGMLRGIRAGPYYNNFPPFYMRGYINDKQSRLMGYAILRQVRIKPELNSYPYWGQMAFYSGGGYVVPLNKDYLNMVEEFYRLEKEGWIDRYTRAVFLEFTVYNPSINLFAISTLISEFQPSGGVFTSYRFEPCMLLPYQSSALIIQLVCEVFYFAFTIFFVVQLIKNLVQQKWGFFKQFWNLVDVGICAMSVTAIVIYFYRLYEINLLTEYFKETHGNEYIKFQYVGYWSEIFNYIMGMLVFLATIKFMKLLRFNKKISLLADTLKNSSKDLIHFSIIFNIVFLAFIQFFYLIYGKHLAIFKTFMRSCEAGVVMIMGRFDIYNMQAVNQWMTQIMLFLFVVSVTFIVVNMLLSILNDTFSAVRKDKMKQKNDYEIVDFMLGRFKMWTGIGQASTTVSAAELEKEQKYRELEEQIDQFPDQIDRRVWHARWQRKGRNSRLTILHPESFFTQNQQRFFKVQCKNYK